MINARYFVKPSDMKWAEEATDQDLAHELERVANEQKAYRSQTIAYLLEAARRLRE